MAYVILVNDDNSLTTTNRERIMQRSKLVDKMWFLVPQMYKEYDMSKFTVMLEYVLPVSRKYCPEILEMSEEMYEDHLKYTLPFDTKLTNESGDIELQLTFTCADLDPDGNAIQLVRKTLTNKVTIVPIAAWSDIIPDSTLSAIDQRLIKMDAQMKALEEEHNLLNESKADNIKYDEEANTIQLLSGENEIGDKVELKCKTEGCEDGVPVTELNGTGTSSGKDEYSDIIEF